MGRRGAPPSGAAVVSGGWRCRAHTRWCSRSSAESGARDSRADVADARRHWSRRTCIDRGVTMTPAVALAGAQAEASACTSGRLGARRSPGQPKRPSTCARGRGRGYGLEPVAVARCRRIGVTHRRARAGRRGGSQCRLPLRQHGDRPLKGRFPWRLRARGGGSCAGSARVSISREEVRRVRRARSDRLGEGRLIRRAVARQCKRNLVVETGGGCGGWAPPSKSDLGDASATWQARGARLSREWAVQDRVLE